MASKELHRPRCPSGQVIRLWIDGELGARQASQVAAHVSSCGSCADEVRERRAIGEAIQAAAPSLRSCPVFLSPDEVLLGAVRSHREEASLISILRRVAAAAALITFASVLLAGWNASSGPRKAEASIRAVAIPAAGVRLGTLIDDENSIMIFIARR